MIGVAMMIVLVVLLASTISGFLLTFDDSLNAPELEGEESSEDLDGPWSDDPLLGPEDPTAAATDVRYRVYFEIEDTNMEGETLSDVKINVTTDDDMFSGTNQSNLETFRVETEDGTEIDVIDDVDDWASEDETKLEMEVGGDEYQNASLGDTIIIVFDGVDNPPDPGTYDVEVTLNEGGDVQEGELEIVEE